MTCKHILNFYMKTSSFYSYMAKFDHMLTNNFRKIHEKSLENKDDNSKIIQNLGNALLEQQQMYNRQAIHIALSLPLH